jgi:hypothetical protein
MPPRNTFRETLDDVEVGGNHVATRVEAPLLDTQEELAESLVILLDPKRIIFLRSNAPSSTLSADLA